MTQSGGQGAGIQLQVGFDLAYFRNQLPSLGTAAAGYSLPIKIHFDRDSITESLRKLGNSLGNKTYKITVQDTNLDLVVKKVDDLADKLKRLSTSINIGLDIGGAAGSTPGTAMKVMAKKLADQFKGDIGAAAKAMEGMRGAAPFGAGTRSIPGFKAAAQGMGLENAFKLFFQELKQVDPQRLAKVLDDGSTMMMRENADIKQGLDAIQSKAKKLASDLGAMGDAAKLTGKAFIEDGGKVLRPQNYGLKIASLLSSVEKLDSDLRKASVETGVDLLSALDDLSSVLRSASNSFVKIAGLSDTLDDTLRGFDTAAKQASRATNAYAERIQRRAGGPPAATAGQPLLPGSRGGALAVQTAGFDPYRVITTQVRESFDIIEDYHKRQLDNFINGYKKIIDQYHRNLLIAAARQRVRNVQVSELAPRPDQGMLSGTRIAGLLSPEPPGRYRYRASRVGETQAELFARREREARMRSLFGSESQLMLPPARPRQLGAPPLYQAPSLPSSGESAYLGGRTGSSVTTRTPGGFIGGGIPSGGGAEAAAFVNASRNALAYSQALGRLQESLKGVQVGQLPLVGSIKGLAGEFGQATKQVLLYGTAYKALAFLTSLPGEAFNAAKALGTYRNQLQAVTAETGTFSNSLAFVDNLAQRFNVPLESARQGFVKLYASMQPAGFSQEQIEGLFTGISQSAAAFGLSADKVDRVNYAFAQMASKGQIMSEELKGQLGDVLPGALALFAEAAKMSIPEFSKAMEDGRFKGDAMVQVLENVGILMKVKFGAAAEGAAKTLQGALNGIQNNLKLMYEALGPVVNRMAAVFGPQVTSLIQSATDVIKAFELGISTTGDSFAAMSPQAQSFYTSIQSILPSVKSLVPSFVAAAQNIGYFAASLATASQPLLGLLKLALDFISIPFVARVGVYATIIGALTSAFILLKNTGIIQATVAMIRFIATLTVGQVQAWIASIQAAIAALVAMARTADLAKLSLMALKVTLISFGVGAVLIGLDFVAQRLLNIGSAANDAKRRTAELTNELARAVEVGNVALTSAKMVETETKVQSLQKSKEILQRFQRGGEVPLSEQDYQRLQRSGLAQGVSQSLNPFTGKPTGKGRATGGVSESLAVVQSGLVNALNDAGEAAKANADAMQVQGNMQRQLEASRSQMKDIPPATGAEGGTAGAASKRVPLDQLLDTESQRVLKLNLSKTDLRLTQLITEAKLQGNEAEAESLEGLSNSLKLRLQLTAAQNFVTMLLDKEDEIIGKSLTKQQFSNKLQDANVEVQTLSNDLQASYLEMQVKENEASKKAKDALNEKIKQQLSLNRLLQDAAIAAGVVSPQQSGIRMQNRGFEDQLLQAQQLGATPEQISFLQTLQAATPQVGSLQEALREIEKGFSKLTSMQEMAKTSANAIGDAFGNAFKGIITGSMTAQQALAGMFQSIADSFADMVAKMIAEWLKAQLIQGFTSILSFLSPGFGTGIAPGPVAKSAGVKFSPTKLGPAFANGGIASGGFRAFANGGIVTGPTLGLVGEGRYNEAVVPLPDGKSIPVSLGGAAGSNISTNIVVNMGNGQGGGSQATGAQGNQLARELEGAVRQVILKESRPGGIIYSR